MEKKSEILICYNVDNKRNIRVLSNRLIQSIYLKNNNFKVTKNEIDSNSGESIADFMKRDTDEDKYVVLIISDEYLKSDYCMDKVLEPQGDKTYHDRIFPIVLSNAKSSILDKEKPYFTYWNEMVESHIPKDFEDYSDADRKDVLNELEIKKRIKKSINQFTRFISKDSKSLDQHEVEESNYSILIKKIIELADEKEAEVDKLTKQNNDQINKVIDAEKLKLVKTQSEVVVVQDKLKLVEELLEKHQTKLNELEIKIQDMDKMLANQKTSEPIVPKKNIEIGDKHLGGLVFLLYPNGGGLVFSIELGSSKWEDADQLCQDCKEGDYKDWRLPSKDELKAMYDEKLKINGFDTGSYWSSTEFEGNPVHYSYFQDISNGLQGRHHKVQIKSVRAVREFSN